MKQIVLMNNHMVLGICSFGYLSVLKNLPAMQETQVWSLGQKDPLEKGMTTRSSILAWRIPWTEESGELQSMGSQRVRHDWATNTHTCLLLPWNYIPPSPDELAALGSINLSSSFPSSGKIYLRLLFPELVSISQMWVL